MQKHLRLRRREDFAVVRTQGQVVPHRLFLFTYHHNNLPHHRYGFVVSKRVGNAVRRNKIRRRLREALRAYHTNIASSAGCDIVLIARSSIVKASFQEITAALSGVLLKSGLMAI